MSTARRVALGVFALLGWLIASHAMAAIGFVQSKSTSQNNSAQTTITATFTIAAQAAGDLNVVAIGWGSTSIGISSIADTKHNTYTCAVGPTIVASLGSAEICYAKNIVAATAGSNVVTVTFSAAVPFPDLRIAEYSGIDTVSPVDVTAAASGTGTTSDSGSVTTTNANDLLVGSSWVASGNSGAGAGYLSREISGYDGDILEDRIVASVGAYSATAPMSPSAAYIMQMAAFKAAASADTSAPGAPGTLMVSAASSSQINLSWGAATDNVGVTGYRVESCQGASCSTFAQIATPTTLTYSATGLTASTSYSFRVRATDAAGNLGAYTNVAPTSTPSAADTSAPSPPSGLNLTAPSSSQINLNWTASTDNVGVTGYRVESCQGASCSTFAQIGTPTAITYSATGLTASTSYSFRVRATDAAGNLGGYSNIATISTQGVPDTMAPSPPSSLSASTMSSTQINLSWSGSTDNVGVTGYRLERCQGANCTTFAQIATPTGITYSDTGLTASTLYRYQIRATDAAGNLSGYSGIATATTTAAGSGPVGWWKLDEGTGTTSADASGNADTGTLLNSPTWTTGRVGPYALSFSGASAGVGVSGSGVLANLFNTGLTVSAWIKPAGAGGGNGGRIVDKDNQNGGWFFAMSSATQIKLTSDQDPSGVTSLASSTSLASITLNTWQHVSATWDGHAGGVMHVYINGVLADGLPTSGSPGSPAQPEDTDSTTPLTIGGRQVDTTRGFNGAIDEVRIYNRVLSSTEIQALADAAVPGAPSSLTAAGITGTQIPLNWTASTDNVGVTGYRIERCQGASCSTFVQVATSTSNSYTDTGLTASTSYSYRVRATDANSNLSGYSNVLSTGTTSGGGDTSAPSAPPGLSTAVISSSQINLSWSASVDNVGVTGYQVDSCAGSSCTNFAPLGSPTATSYNATGLTSATTYNFRVLAKDAAGNQSLYSTISATTPGGGDTSAPSPPAGLHTTSVSPSQISLTWTASTDNVGVTGYTVESCAGANCTAFAPFGSPTTTTSFNATALSASTYYSFRVRASDAAGNSSNPSNVVTATTYPAGSICD